MKVTVYIPTKNRCAFLSRAVNSVLRQTYDDIDLIIVDDGSTDDTRKYLHDMETSGKLRAIFNRNSYGACVARNEAIEAAHGEFVTGLDDDDFFRPERITSFVKSWENVLTANGTPAAGLFDSISRKLNNQVMYSYEQSVVCRNDLRKANFIGNQVFAPRDHYINAGLFDPLLPAWQDWDLWLRMATKYGDFINMKRSTYGCVLGQSNVDGAIRNRPEFMMRYASQLIAHKHKMSSLSERSALIVSLLNYGQVMPSLHEIGILLLGGHVRVGLRGCLKKSRLLPLTRRLFSKNHNKRVARSLEVRPG